jgi:hypothetical protein
LTDLRTEGVAKHVSPYRLFAAGVPGSALYVDNPKARGLIVDRFSPDAGVMGLTTD